MADDRYLKGLGIAINLSTFAFSLSRYSWVFMSSHQSHATQLEGPRASRTGRMTKNEEERAYWAGRVRKLEDTLKDTAKENEKLKEEVAQLRTWYQKAADSFRALSHALKREQEDKAATEQTLRREEAEKGKALSQIRRLTAEFEAARRQRKGEADLKLQHWETKHDELTALLEFRTRELKAAQVYLTKVDTVSGAEVIALVDALNVEILQTSAFISDSFTFARQPTHADEMKKASIRIGELMGSSLIHLLGTVLHSEDPLLVQIALQGATVELSRRIIMSWNFADHQAKQLLADIYNDIRETETQAVGGRWRALTRAHGRKITLKRTDLHASMVARTSNTLVDILVAAGSTKTYEETYRTFTQKFGERISDIVNMASRLNKVMGEEVTSADLWPTLATSGTKFDGALMEDVGEDGQDSQGKAILCTIALGLQRSEKVAQGNVVDFKTTTLLKPKVALKSIADSLQREDSSRRGAHHKLLSPYPSDKFQSAPVTTGGRPMTRSKSVNIKK